jgi:hypothetical protein
MTTKHPLLKKFFFFLATFLFSVCLLISPPTAQAQDAVLLEVDDLEFYEGPNCTEDRVFTYNSEVAADENCQERETQCYGDNDEARSLKIIGFARPGTRIKVFDSPTAATDDDYTLIQIQDNLPLEGACVETFEVTKMTPGFKEIHRHKNGLDGKVSHVTILP